MPQNKLPNFLVIGAMKSGTTTFYELLKDHPQIFMSPTKEPNFFADDANWVKGTEWYQSFFDGAQNKKSIGEASTAYSKYPFQLEIPERIFKVLGAIKIIYLLRNPIDRMWSHFIHNLHKHRIRGDFVETIEKDNRYLHASLYFSQLNLYTKFFPVKNIKILIFDDLVINFFKYVKETYSFLNVDDDYIPKKIPQVFNASDKKLEKMKSLNNQSLRFLPIEKKLSRYLKEEIIKTLEKEIVGLEKFLGRKMSFWNIRESLDMLLSINHE